MDSLLWPKESKSHVNSTTEVQTPPQYEHLTLSLFHPFIDLVQASCHSFSPKVVQSYLFSKKGSDVDSDWHEDTLRHHC